MNILLTFILPVYNVEKYLSECLESILCQATSQCEIILVNDGSTDSSSAICEEYAGKYDEIKVIHKENGGLSSARNAGLQRARGRYVSFIDSDDRIANGSVGEILSWIENGGADICFMQGLKFYPDGSTRDLGDMVNSAALRGKPIEQIIKYLSTRPKYPGSACTKIFNKQFLDENNLRFPKDRRFSEDLGFIRDCLYLSKTIDCLDIPFYEYRQNREGSITNTFNYKKFADLSLFVIETVEGFCEQRKAINDKASNLMSFVAYEYCILIRNAAFLRVEEKSKAQQFLTDYKWVLKFANSRKCKAIKICTRLLGLKWTSKLLKKVKK